MCSAVVFMMVKAWQWLIVAVAVITIIVVRTAPPSPPPQQQHPHQHQQQQQQQRHEHLVECRCVNYMSGISSINTTLFWYLATDIVFEASNNSGDFSYKTGHIYRVVFFEGGGGDTTMVCWLYPFFWKCIPVRKCPRTMEFYPIRIRANPTVMATY